MRFILFLIACFNLSATQFDPLAIRSVWNSKFNEYLVPDVVDCFGSRPNTRQQLWYVFMGDSRIRQQFYSFVQMFPDNDFHWDGASSERMKVQSDMDARSELFNIKISFRWRNNINEAMFNDFLNWLNSGPNDQPTLLIIGLGLHYMGNNLGLEAFQIDLTTLEPYIRKLTRISTVIWMSQLPTIERHIKYYFGASNEQSFDIITEFNAKARDILKRSSVLFWNSSYALAFEYNRACGENYRTDETWYHLCSDHVHTGYVAIYQATQQILKFICLKMSNLQLSKGQL